MVNGAESHWADFQLHLTWTEGDTTIAFKVPVGAPVLIFVDDDNGTQSDTSAIKALDSLEVVYRNWNIYENGLPTDLADYQAVMWNCSHAFNPLSTEKIALLSNYLDNGGRLFLAGTNIASGTSGDFLAQYLHLAYSNQVSLLAVIGVNGDPVGDSLTLFLSSTSTDQDKVTPVNGGIVCFNYVYVHPCGIRFESNYKVVTFTFAFDDIRWDSPSADKPDQALSQVLSWLDMEMSVREDFSASPVQSFVLYGNFPNPFNPNTNISFNLPEASEVAIEVFNISGQKVWEQKLGLCAPGEMKIEWDGTSQSRIPLSSGLLLYRITAESANREFKAVGKMLLLK
jgi:hypothetical protein